MTICAPFILAMLLALHLRAQPDPSADARVARFQEMKYPLKARLGGQSGVVVVRLKIDSAGAVTGAESITGIANLADDAVANARQWKFQQGRDGRSLDLVYVFTRSDGLCEAPCASQFLFYPPALVTVTIGTTTVSHGAGNEVPPKPR